ncbi:MAG: inner membrane-spanning protein YciB [Maricaulaceae bacterium]
MTDTSQTPPQTPAAKKQKPSQMLEFGPLLVFFILYQVLKKSQPDNALYIAAAVLAGLSVLTLIYSRIKYGSLPMMLVFTTVLVSGSAALAYFFKDERFIYMKPTVINSLFGVAVIGGVLVKKNVIQMIMGSAIEMPLKAWNVLAIRWGIFFFILAGINEFVWRTYGEDFWVKFKVFGFLPLTILFTMSQLPFIMKNGSVKTEDTAK